jgi:nucleoside-diphosphate-sugar epimerase
LHSRADTTRARGALGWTAEVSLAEGIELTKP